jgi:hypothetical protein
MTGRSSDTLTTAWFFELFYTPDFMNFSISL